MKGHSAFTKTPELQRPHIKMFSVMCRTLIGKGCLAPLQGSSLCILQPQQTGQIDIDIDMEVPVV